MKMLTFLDDPLMYYLKVATYNIKGTFLFFFYPIQKVVLHQYFNSATGF